MNRSFRTFRPESGTWPLTINIQGKADMSMSNIDLCCCYSKPNKPDSHLNGFRPSPTIDEWGSAIADTSVSVVGTLMANIAIDPTKFTGGQTSASADVGAITSTSDFDLPALAKQAANASGFSAEVCERILSEFIEHQKRVRRSHAHR